MRKLVPLVLAILSALFSPTVRGQTKIDYNTQVKNGPLTRVLVLPATCTPGVTQPVQLSVYPFLIYQCIATNTWKTIGSSGGAWGQSIDVTQPAYGAKFDAQVAFSTTLNSTTTVVTGANDPPFCILGVTLCPFGVDAGKVAFSVQAAASGTQTSTSCPDTTISSVTGIHTAILALSCTVTGSTNQQFVWGTPDDVPLTAASLAASANCGNVLLPAGNTLISSGFGNESQLLYCLLGGGGARTSKTWSGAGRNATRIILRPSFNYSTSNSCNGILIATYSGCLMSALNTNIQDLMIWCVNYGPSGNTRNVAMVAIGQSGKNNSIQNVEINMCNATDTTTVGLAVTGSATGVHNVIVDGSGYSPLYSGGGWVTIDGSPCFFGDTPNYALFAGSANLPTFSSGCVYSSDALGTGNSHVFVTGGLNSVNDTFGSFNATGPGLRGITVGGSGVLNIVNGSVDLSSSPTGAFALVAVSGAVINATNTVFKATNTTGTALFLPVGSIFHDNGFNTYLTTSPNSIAGSFLNEANSANAVPVTAGKLVLSAGWGTTATVTALSGGDAPIQFTITNSGTGQGSSPTIVYTFATPYPVAPFYCSAVQNPITPGTNAVGTFTVSGLSTTGLTLTFSLTPTPGSTEIVDLTCLTP